MPRRGAIRARHGARPGPRRSRRARPSAPTGRSAALRARRAWPRSAGAALSSRCFRSSSGAPPARSSRISSSSSLSANTSSRSAGGTCLLASSGPRAASPSSCRRYSTRAIGCRSVRYASFRYDAPLETRAALRRRGVVEVIRMKLPAQRSGTAARDRPHRCSAFAAGRGRRNSRRGGPA